MDDIIKNDFVLFLQQKVNGALEEVGYEILLRDSKDNHCFPVLKFEEVRNNQAYYLAFLTWFEVEIRRLLDNYPKSSFSINFTRAELFYDETMALLDRIKVNSDRLTIEVTEEVVINFRLVTEIKGKSFISQLKKIKEMGYQVSIDDISSGQNSVGAILEWLPFIDELKISHVNFLKLGLERQALASLIEFWQSFCEKNSLRLVIEGIEEEAVFNQLKKQGLTLFQGFYFSMPFQGMGTNR